MGSLFSGLSGKTEEVPYDVIQSLGNFEIRQYNERVVAETLISNSNKLTDSRGFRTLANYIFGKNEDHMKISMTSPVEVRPNERCASNVQSGPVLSEALLGGGSGMFMRFTLPRGFKESEVPKPIDVNVNIFTEMPQKFATLRFSGAWTETLFADRGEELLQELQNTSYQPVGPIVSLRYDPPWTFSCFRRNEVAVEVQAKSKEMLVAM